MKSPVSVWFSDFLVWLSSKTLCQRFRSPIGTLGNPVPLLILSDFRRSPCQLFRAFPLFYYLQATISAIETNQELVLLPSSLGALVTGASGFSDFPLIFSLLWRLVCKIAPVNHQTCVAHWQVRPCSWRWATILLVSWFTYAKFERENMVGKCA